MSVSDDQSGPRLIFLLVTGRTTRNQFILMTGVGLTTTVTSCSPFKHPTSVLRRSGCRETYRRNVHQIFANFTNESKE